MPDEKVLDVPAIDMTEAGLAKRKPAKRAASKPRKTRDGSIGKATFEAVNTLIADGSMTKNAAFAAYGKQTKTQPGTVAANYYRVARAAGTVKPASAVQRLRLACQEALPLHHRGEDVPGVRLDRIWTQRLPRWFRASRTWRRR